MPKPTKSVEYTLTPGTPLSHQEHRIRLDYHLGADRVTRSCRTFHKDGQSQIVQVGGLRVLG